MKSNKPLICAALASVLAIGLVNVTSQAADDSADKEKCQGVAKKGKNDCAANGHACAGQSKRDADAKEWLYVPTGTCEKLVNGRIVREKAKK